MQSADDEWSVNEVIQRNTFSSMSEYLERLKEGRIKGILKTDSKILEELGQKIRQLQQQVGVPYSRN